MSALNNSLLLGAPAGGATGYSISRSLRFSSGDSSFLSRTFASSGTRTTWTYSFWLKRASFSSDMFLLHAEVDGNNETVISFDTSNRLQIYNYASGSFNARKASTAVHRDPSAWAHYVVTWDTSNSTAADRVRLYANGSRLTAFDTSTDPAQNTLSAGINVGRQHRIGSRDNTVNYLLNGYLADIHFIDGQALDPTSFGEFSATTGVWVPKAYSGGSYGSQGWHLDFADNSAATAAALGKDTSGNGNNWSPSNLSVTAGAGNDSLVDVPTNGSEVDTGLGGQVRGNYCTWDPLAVSSQGAVPWTLSNGNLVASDATVNIYGTVPGTMAVSSGKWYWEVTVSLGVGGIDVYQGVGVESANLTGARNLWSAAKACYYNGDGQKMVDTVLTTYGSAWALGDVIGVALNMDASTVTFYRNNVSQGSISIVTGGAAYRPAVSDFNNAKGSVYTANFGQRPFTYTAPSGFKALCTANLPAPLVTKPSTAFDVKLYTGNGGTQTISGLGFSPDLVWIKNRSAAQSNQLWDVVRGVSKRLISDSTGAEVDRAPYGLTSFDSTGFAVADTSTGAYEVNGPVGGSFSGNAQYAAWCWDAGSSTVTNTAGTISSQVRANASAGFSVVTYTGTGLVQTVGHGLGVAPQLMIVKQRTNAGWSWNIYHSSLGATDVIRFTTAATTAVASIWNNTAPTSTVFTVGNANEINQISSAYVAYCFAPVSGYSAFGSYTGNGQSGDSAPFIWTGFRPRWVLIKNSTATGSWLLLDTARDTYNVSGLTLSPDASTAESSNDSRWDILSNGFKIRNTYSNQNSSSATYVYAAFAESPFAANNRAC